VAKMRGNGDAHPLVHPLPQRLPPLPPRSEAHTGADISHRERRPWNPLALPDGERGPERDDVCSGD